jgi:hypothetical protein
MIIALLLCIASWSAKANGPEWDLNTTPATYTIIGVDSGDSLGYALATGDLNGDKKADLLLGAIKADGPANSRDACGEVYVLYCDSLIGSRDLALNPADYIIYGDNSGLDAHDQLGRAVAVGDINGDGSYDLIVCAPDSRGGGATVNGIGKVYILYGNGLTGGKDLRNSQADFTILGPNLAAHLGTKLSVNDLNNDGKWDVITVAMGGWGPNAHRRFTCGETYVEYGAQLSGQLDLASDQAADYTVWGQLNDTRLGLAVAAGDINGDGVMDLIISAYGPSSRGEVYVIYGDSLRGLKDLATSPADFVIYGTDDGDMAGSSLAVGDVNGDDEADIILGSPGTDGLNNSKTQGGEVDIIYGGNLSGEKDLSTSPADFTIYAGDAGDSLGSSVAATDVNGDGKMDLILGAVGGDGPDNTRKNCGEAYLIYGSNLLGTKDLAQSPAQYTIYGADPSDHFGFSATSGDVNGDGRTELLISALNASGVNNAKSGCGEVYLLEIPVRDAGAISIDEPKTVEIGKTYTPKATVKNYGAGPINFETEYKVKIGDTLDYVDTVAVSNLDEGATQQVSFKEWPVTKTGVIVFTVATLLAGDAVPDNDTIIYPIVAVAENKPNQFAYPAHLSFANPTHGKLTVNYNLPAKGRITLKIYDSAGNLIKTLIDGILPQGSGRVVWDGKDSARRTVQSSIYFVRLVAPNSVIVRKFVLVN